MLKKVTFLLSVLLISCVHLKKPEKTSVRQIKATLVNIDYLDKDKNGNYPCYLYFLSEENTNLKAYKYRCNSYRIGNEFILLIEKDKVITAEFFR